MEYFDVLDRDGIRTGETLTRKEVHRTGAYHRAVHIFLFNAKGDVLLQRRSAHVDHFADMWAISVTGHIGAGEYSSQAAERELQEEIGVSGGDVTLRFLFSFYQEATLAADYIDRQFNDVYVVEADLPVSALRVDPQEVSDVRYVAFEEFARMVSDPSSRLAPVYHRECRDLVYFLRAGRGRV